MGSKYKAESYRQIVKNLPPFYLTATKRRRKAKSIEYLNEAVTFDIETTSYNVGLYKTCWMYCWQCYFHGHVYMGRNWEEFEWFLGKISDHFGDVVVPVYIHNMGFEFSFMRKVFKFEDVFCVKNLKPVRARYKNIEFRDSLVLSGLPLEQLPTDTKKLKGDLDYLKIRHEKTPLTKEEIAYCVNDVVVLKEYIELKMADDDLAHIPMTRTGYVRRDIKSRMKYCRVCDTLKLSFEQYEKFESLFCGGFTHASAATEGLIIHCVRSLDITSSYPTVMVVELFPMSPFTPVAPEDYDRHLKTRCCVFKLTMTNVYIKEESPDCIISKSKCIDIDPRCICNNGRVDSADYLTLWCNEVDLKWYKRFYHAEFYISEMESAKKGPLPKEFIEAVLYYYSQKTQYKGVKGKEEWYALMKELLNALYGFQAQKPIKPPIVVNEDGDWVSTKEYFKAVANEVEGEYSNLPGDPWLVYQVYMHNKVDDYNNDKTRVNFYPWAAWVTSYARQNLFELMWKCGADYLYSDTDSIKMTNYFQHKAAFDRYNRKVIARIRDQLKSLGIDPTLALPKDPKGVCRPLGVFTDEGEYWDFKTLGAKRYAYEDIEGTHVTVAGAPKKQITKYLGKFGNPLVHFNEGLVVPAEESGDNLVTQVNSSWEGMVTDYTGITHYVYTRGGTHIQPCPVNMKVDGIYQKYCMCRRMEDPEYQEHIDIGLI